MLWEMLESPREHLWVNPTRIPGLFRRPADPPDEDWYEHWRSLTVKLYTPAKANVAVVRIHAVWGVRGRVGPVRSDVIRLGPGSVM